MNKILEIQTLLLKWLRYFPETVHSRAKINALCEDLFCQYYPGKKSQKPFYEIFEPLLRMGLVEVCGHLKYRLSPTIFLFDFHGIVGINIPDFLIEQLANKNIDFDKDEFGFVRFSIQYKRQIQLICECANIPIQPTNISLFIAQLPSIRKVVTSFSEETVFNSKYFQYFSSGKKWEFTSGLIGIYRESENTFSNRYFFDGKNWFLLPRKKNPDAFAIAVCYADILNNCPLEISYNKQKLELHIQNIYFPILLERLLFRQNLTQKKPFKYSNNLKIYTNISLKLFKQVNRIFENKIIIT